MKDFISGVELGQRATENPIQEIVLYGSNMIRESVINR